MSRRSPFTIIELLAVMVIISILAALILGVSKYATDKSREAKTLSHLQALEDAIEQFKEDRGYYPPTAGFTNGTIQLGDQFAFGEKLKDLPANHRLQSGNFVNSQTGVPYIPGYNGGPYLDASGRPFLYRCDDSTDQKNKNSFDLWSAGRDGIVNTEDDITNWKRN